VSQNRPSAPSRELESQIGRIVDEFANCLARGQHPDIEDYVCQHPELADILREVLPAVSLLADFSQAGAAGPTAKASAVAGQLGDFRVIREIFEDRYADLGGVLDTSTNLVWGYDAHSFSGIDITLSWLAQIGDNGAYLYCLNWALNYYSDPTSINYDPVKAAEMQSALTIAEQYTWRRPTVTEARDAVAKGLFTYGAGGCNIYYGSPIAPNGPFISDPGTFRWTSVAAKPARGGALSAWAWEPDDGFAELISDSAISCIWVRTAQ
jgi:hypothetical protein